jgi:hypothetical protein
MAGCITDVDRECTWQRKHVYCQCSRERPGSVRASHPLRCETMGSCQPGNRAAKVDSPHRCFGQTPARGFSSQNNRWQTVQSSGETLGEPTSTLDSGTTEQDNLCFICGCPDFQSRARCGLGQHLKGVSISSSVPRRCQVPFHVGVPDETRSCWRQNHKHSGSRVARCNSQSMLFLGKEQLRSVAGLESDALTFPTSAALDVAARRWNSKH